MEYCKNGDYIEIYCDDDFCPERIFECGQCFRWNKKDDNRYVGVAGGRYAEVELYDGKIRLLSSSEDFESFWKTYFDLDLNYKNIRSLISIDDYITEAAQFGSGIRILRQEKWEALCSFIISQCNNIPRIKGIIERLCKEFGVCKKAGDFSYCTFPEVEVIAQLSEDDLAPIKCGYRAEYIIDAARKVVSGELDIEMLEKQDNEEILRQLKMIKGVGDKVAGCVLLFGFHRLDAFPIDVWIKRVIKERYGKGFKPSVFGEYAGVAQQYMFYHARSKG